MQSLSVYLINLGCAKNLVDSELMTGLLQAGHFHVVEDPALAHIIIVNTCGFIRSAKEESIAALLELAQYKKTGNCSLLIAVGCMVEKYEQEMREAMPEVDEYLGTNRYQEILPILYRHFPQYVRHTNLPHNLYLMRQLTDPKFSAYIKIAEGCNNCCSYCLIPQLRGPYKSRKMEDIIQEAAELKSQGVLELNVVAQDTSNYGHDLYGKPMLPALLEQLAKLDFTWIRLLYVYPTLIDETLLSVIAAHKNICHYLDIPLQHGDSRILKAMNRRGDVDLIKEKVALCRKIVPDIALRTTMMVGFPGEDKRAWLNMLQFLSEMQFDWVGVFAYCREEDTPAATFAHQVRESTKQTRLDLTMQHIAQITAINLQKYIGMTLDVLVEKEAEQLPDWVKKRPKDGIWYQGRSQYQAPEVDGMIYFCPKECGRVLKPGTFEKVLITASDIYDLRGELK